MRSKIAQLFALSCLISAFPSLIQAQFQAPTKEELQMTSDPKRAWGGCGLPLSRREDGRQSPLPQLLRAYKSAHGKGQGTRHRPHALRTSQLQGHRHPGPHHSLRRHRDSLTAKPSDLTDVKTKDMQVNTMVFTLPSVEVGSILEYRLQIRYDDDMVSSPTWQVQQPYFVRKAHYLFQPSSELAYITNSRGDAANRLMYAEPLVRRTQRWCSDATGRYSLDVSDVPPIPTDDWMPPLNSIKWRVEFYYTGYIERRGVLAEGGKRWAKETDHFASPSKTLKEAVAKIVTPADTDEQKARKLYAEVMKLDNTDFTREKSSAELKNEKLKQIKDAEDVWTQKSGTSDDIALLYVALARAAGLHVYPMQVVNRNRAIFDQNYFSASLSWMTTLRSSLQR